MCLHPIPTIYLLLIAIVTTAQASMLPKRHFFKSIISLNIPNTAFPPLRLQFDTSKKYKSLSPYVSQIPNIFLSCESLTPPHHTTQYKHIPLHAHIPEVHPKLLPPKSALDTLLLRPVIHSRPAQPSPQLQSNPKDPARPLLTLQSCLDTLCEWFVIWASLDLERTLSGNASGEVVREGKGDGFIRVGSVAVGHRGRIQLNGEIVAD